MTRKDYIRFAAMLKQERVFKGGSLAQDMIMARFTAKIADIFEQDNPRFNRAKFLKACGVES